ncbi:MAG: terpene cyclase/mutase family protein [Planctomycetes bacterium]|nr:terpene cyclase/mutase family protein [Planctomycetota bacterium]
MNRFNRFLLVALSLGLMGFLPSHAPAQDAAEKQKQRERYQEAANKGLEWLKKTQHPKDGSWSANGQNPISMTGMAGLALLCEGSTVNQGKYRDNIRLAADFLMKKASKGGGTDGLIGNPQLAGETGRYMYGHGFALLFLACVYGEEDDKERRAELKDILTRAVKYCGSAQSSHGGWFYTAKGDPPGSDNDEGSVTVTQMQALRACRDAGIPVPKQIMEKGADYLRKSTTPDGGVVYSLGRGGFGAPAGGGRPALTAAAIACLFSAGNYLEKKPDGTPSKEFDPYIKKWFQFCNSPRGVPLDRGAGGGGFNRLPFDEYTHFYYAPSIYFIGEDGWEKMFGKNSPNPLTWSLYKKTFVEGAILRPGAQNGDGSWQGAGGWGSGPIYTTSVYCVILQLENNCLPVFQK